MSILVKRHIFAFIRDDLKEKMVFLGGPRQVGKTTLAQLLIKNYYDNHPAYLNWDDSISRKKIINREWPHEEKLIIFDEIHKYAKWKNLVKGHYDILKNTHSFLITGSARLNVFRRGGDSLLGRYYYHRLHPLTLSEVGYSKEKLQDLMLFSGFPEPFLKNNEKFLKRWHKDRMERIVLEDLRDMEKVNDIHALEILAEMLPGKVGAPLSIKSVSEDLSVDFKTARKWIEIFERLYYCYRIAPYGAPKVRAVKKEQKLYMFDWTQVEEQGFRFENLVASHLLKYCNFLEDTEGEKMELRFLRDTDKREVDFVVLKNKKPLFAVECKTGDKGLSRHISYFRERTDIPEYYQVHMGTREISAYSNVTILPFVKFAKKFGL